MIDKEELFKKINKYEKRIAALEKDQVTKDRQLLICENALKNIANYPYDASECSKGLLISSLVFRVRQAKETIEQINGMKK